MFRDSPPLGEVTAQVGSVMSPRFSLPQPKSLLGTGPNAVTKASTTARVWSRFCTWAGVSAPYFCNSRATAPVTCGAAMLVPWLVACFKPGRSTSGEAQEAKMSPERTEAIAVPGAPRSGLERPSRVGPGLEKLAMLPTGGWPNWAPPPPQSIQLCRVTYAPAAMVLLPVAMALMISSPGWLPTTKLYVPPVLLEVRNRSISPAAAPITTGVKVNVQVPLMIELTALNSM